MKDLFKSEVHEIINCYKNNQEIRTSLNFYDKKDFIINSYKNMYPRLKDIKTLNQKISWISIFDCNDLKAFCSDKIKLHDYCINKIGKDLCVPIIKVYDDVNSFDISQLPDEFIVKCNHGYNQFQVIKDKNILLTKQFRYKFKYWLDHNFGYHSNQLHYCNIMPKLFLEEYLGSNLMEYKIWCFCGKPVFLGVVIHEDIKTITHYNLNFQKIKNEFCYDECPHEIRRPKNFDIMLDYCTKLCYPFNLCRVDFYDVNDRIYLGELTFTPSGGNVSIHSIADNKYGKLLDLDYDNR